MSRSQNIMSKSFLAFCFFALFVASAGASGQKRLVGGRQAIELKEDEKAQKFLNDAVHQHNANLNTTDNLQRVVLEVQKSEAQVVAGMKYIFTVKMAKTNCTVDSEQEVCVILQESENAEVYTCTFTAWTRPWLDLTTFNEECDKTNP